MQHIFKDQIATKRLSVPHILQQSISPVTTAIIAPDYKIKEGDEIGIMVRNGDDDIFQKTHEVKEIVERRKARGDWSRADFNFKPDFIKFKTK